ncbi:hypothetical protein ACEZDB_19760 [Streptacidiphilus sp. N1-3]|uniref:Uncharacterized protein n=1 Tax=Streptacidiphilus alkalitolerans TaxID=3342712 RepID=A0ABV6X3K7_9ACTN
MKTTLIKTTGRPMTAACFGMPAAALSFVAPAIPGFGGLEGSDLSALWTITRDERPTSALVAAVGANRGYVYAAGAGNHQQVLAQNSKKSQHHAERTFRGPEPWRERT